MHPQHYERRESGCNLKVTTQLLMSLLGWLGEWVKGDPTSTRGLRSPEALLGVWMRLLGATVIDKNSERNVDRGPNQTSIPFENRRTAERMYD